MMLFSQCIMKIVETNIQVLEMAIQDDYCCVVQISRLSQVNSSLYKKTIKAVNQIITSQQSFIQQTMSTKNKAQYLFPRIGIVNLQTITNTTSLLSQIQSYHGKYFQIFNLTNSAIFTNEKSKQFQTKFKWRGVPFSLTEAVRVLAKLEQFLRLNKGNAVVFCVSNTDSESFVKVIVREFFKVCMLGIHENQSSKKFSNNTKQKLDSIFSQLTQPLFSQCLHSLLTTHQIACPPVKAICSLQLSSSSFIPLFEIWQQSRYNDFQLVYTHQICNQLVSYYFNLNKPLQVDKKSIGRKYYDNKPQKKYLNRPVVVCGDVKIIVYSFNTLQKTKQFTFGFNTKQLQFSQQLGENEGIITFTYDDIYIDNHYDSKSQQSQSNTRTTIPKNQKSGQLMDKSIQVYIKVQNWCSQQQQCIYQSSCEQCQQNCKRLNLRYNQTKTEINVRNFVVRGLSTKFNKCFLYYDSNTNPSKDIDIFIFFFVNYLLTYCIQDKFFFKERQRIKSKTINFYHQKSNIMDECQNDQISQLLQQQIIYQQLNRFHCSLVKLLLQNMSIFQIPPFQGSLVLNKEKHQKIYVFSRKKHQTLTTPHQKSHLFQIYQIAQTGSSLRYGKNANQRKGCIEQLYPSFNNNDEDPQRFHLEYKKQPVFQSISQKRKCIKQKLVLHLQTSTLKPDHPKPKPLRLQSFCQTKAITSKSLIPKMKSFDKYSTDSPIGLSINVKCKKISLTELDKLRGIQQVSCQTKYFRKKKKGRSYRQKGSPATLSLPKEMEFINTGVINGLRIVSRRHCQQQHSMVDKINISHPYLLSPADHTIYTRSKSLQHQLPSSLDKSYDTTPIDHCNNFSRYIRQSNSINLNANPNQRVSRKNILQLRRRRSLEANSMKVTQFNNQSLINIQKLTPKNQTKYLPKI